MKRGAERPLSSCVLTLLKARPWSAPQPPLLRGCGHHALLLPCSCPTLALPLLCVPGSGSGTIPLVDPEPVLEGTLPQPWPQPPLLATTCARAPCVCSHRRCLHLGGPQHCLSLLEKNCWNPVTSQYSCTSSQTVQRTHLWARAAIHATICKCSELKPSGYWKPLGPSPLQTYGGLSHPPGPEGMAPGLRGNQIA